MCQNNAIEIVERHFQGKIERGLPTLCFSDGQMRSIHCCAIYHDHCNTHGSYRFDGIMDNSYPVQHIPKTGRTQFISYPRKLASKISRAHDIIPTHLVPMTPRNKDISNLGQVVSKTTRTVLVDQIESKENVSHMFF